MKRCFAVFALALLISVSAGAAKELSTSQSLVVNASAEQVWALLVDADNWAEWNPAVAKAKVVKGAVETPGGKVKFTPVIGGKKAVSVTLKVDKVSSPELLEFIAGGPGPAIVFGFKVEYWKDGVTVTSYETITGPTAVFFEKMYGQDGLDREHREWVEAIKEKLESE